MTENTESFDPLAYIDEIIVEIGMQNEDEAKLSTLKEAMLEALSSQIYQAAGEHIEPEVIDLVMEELKDEEDPGFIIQELVQTSPRAQLAILEVIDDFKKNTLEAFNKVRS